MHKKKHFKKIVISFLTLSILMGGGIASFVNRVRAQERVVMPGEIVDTVTPTGTTIHVFDYWQFDDDHLKHDYAEDVKNAQEGINKDKDLKFTNGKVGKSSSNNINNWVGYIYGTNNDGQAYQGIVEDKLVNGYPMLASGKYTGMSRQDKTSRASLDYLFDPNLDVAGREVYTNVENLLQVDEENYYFYDSDQYFASLNKQTKQFSVQKLAETGHATLFPGFFPFNTLNGNATDCNERRNYHFGTMMTTRFLQTKGGVRADDQPITYHFSGDDDVWIFIDDVLVADLGGIHGKVGVDINFETGEIDVNGQIQYLEDLLGTDDGRPNTRTLQDDTLHTLKFFYLERGAGGSNLNLKFNLVSVPDSRIEKTDELGNPLPGAKMGLYLTDNTYYVADNATPIATGTTDKDGQIILVDEEDRLIYFKDLYLKDPNNIYYVLREISAPSGYRKMQDMHLKYDHKTGAILTENHWTTGAYASGKLRAYIDNDQGKDPYAFFKPLDGHTTAKDFMTDGMLEEGKGMFFALPLRYMGNPDGDLADDSNWFGVYEKNHDYFISREQGMKGIVEAVKKGGEAAFNKFILNANGQYQVDIEKLPGLLKEYYFYLHESGSPTENTKWSTGFYYTSANTFEEINEYNTVRLARSDDFTRQFAAVFNVPNIKNELFVRKVDDAMNHINGVTFSLYPLQPNEDFKDPTITAEALRKRTPYGTMTTQNLTIPSIAGKTVEVEGTAVYPNGNQKPLVNGKYYLVETDVPEGYLLNDSVVEVYVDDTGVYANATASGIGNNKEDGIVVNKGVGYLVDTMSQFAYGSHITENTYIDTTLHNITVQMQSSDDGYNFWHNVGDEFHLQYGADGAVMNYGPLAGQNGQLYGIAEDGWNKLVVKQCIDHNTKGSYFKDLGETDINRLFSGYTIVEFENKRVTDIEISKVVEGYQGMPTADLDKLRKEKAFTFDIELRNPDGSLVTEEYTIVGKSNQNPIGKVVGGKATVSLKHNESFKILDVPFGVKYKITEREMTNQTNQKLFDVKISSNNTKSVMTGNVVEGVVEDVIIENNETVPSFETIQNVFTNTYRIQPTEIEINASKLLTDNLTDSKYPWSSSDRFKFIIERADQNGKDPLPNPNTVEVFGNDQVNVIKEFAFEKIEFTRAGTYNYRIKEVIPEEALPGISYSGAIYNVEVEVTDDMNGHLEATVKSRTEVINDAGLLSGHVLTADEKILFTNTYNATAANFRFIGKKVFITNNSDKGLAEGEFSFELKPIQVIADRGQTSADMPSIPMPEGSVGSSYISYNGAGGNIHFGTIPLTDQHVGYTFEYEVREVNGQKTGITYDSSVYTLRLHVGETIYDGISLITPSVTYLKDGQPYTGGNIEFTNSYTPIETTVQLAGNKTFVGRDMLPNETFNFTLSAGNKETENAINTDKVVVLPNPTVLSVSGLKDGQGKAFTFGTMTFKKAGTYLFKVEEEKPAVPSKGITYDEEAVWVTVTVEDQGGQLKATVSYSKNQKVVDSAVFMNTYSEIGNLALSGKKVMDGRNFMSGDSFTFKVEGSQGAPMPSAVNQEGIVTIQPTAGKESGIDFGNLQFTAPGTYTYTIKEVEPTEAGQKISGVTYSKEVYTVKVEAVEDKSHPDGELNLTTTITKNGEAAEMVWTNTYHAQGELSGATHLRATKKFIGKAWEDEVFTFVLEANPNSAFTIKAIEEGYVVLPENNEITVTKPMDSSDTVTFNFGNIVFKDQVTTEVVGQHYQFIIREKQPTGNQAQQGITYDRHVYHVHVNVSDNGDGTLKIQPHVISTEGGNVFTNTYQAQQTISEPLVASKTLRNKEMEAEMFTFHITPVSATKLDGQTMLMPAEEMPRHTVSSVKNQASSEIGAKTRLQFGTAAFNQEGIYTYEVKEDLTGTSDVGNNKVKDDILYDQHVYRVVYKVTDNKKGAFTIERTVDGQKEKTLDFVNTYEVKPTSVVLTGTKSVEKDNLYDFRLEKDQFGFKIEALNGAPKPTKEIVTNDENGNIKFEIPLNQASPAGGYDYQITEVKGNFPGITYSGEIYKVNVVVSSNGKGQLVATTKVIKASSGEEVDKTALDFVNVYDPLEIKATITGMKKYNRPLTENEFDFKLEANDEATLKALGTDVIFKNGAEYLITSHDALGNINFGEGAITFKKAGVYSFKVSEVQGNNQNVTYDDTVYVLRANVTDVNGTLAVSWNEEINKISFTNTYKPFSTKLDLTAKKTLNGRKMEANEFRFEVVDPENQVVSTGTNDENGNIVFTAIPYEEAGTYHYEVREVHEQLPGVTYDETIYRIIVEVTDENGQLKASLQLEEGVTGLDFVNEYQAASTKVQLGALKTLKNRELKENEFTFVLKDSEGHVVSKATNNALGEIMFDELTFDKVGIYSYKLIEERGQDSSIQYDENVYDISIEIKDDLKGNLYSKIVIQKNGETVEEVVFNNVYTEELPAPIDPDDSGSASTNDHYHVTLYVGMFTISGLILAILCVLKMKKAINQKS